MNIINGKFNPEELIKIYGIKPFIGDIKGLSIYNDTPYFNIQKFYNNGELCGYGVISLGYNGLTSPDALLEDIAYWKGSPEDLVEFLNKVINAKDYSFPIENFYYDREKYDELICSDLAELGFKETSRQR